MSSIPRRILRFILWRDLVTQSDQNSSQNELNGIKINQLIVAL